jgi:hypothetical protein
VTDASSLFDEAELPVEADRRLVLREHAQRQLVEIVRPRPLDRRGDQRGSHAAPDWRLRCNSVPPPLKEERQRTAIRLLRESDLDGPAS